MGKPSRLRRAWPWLAAVLSGLLLMLCFPPFKLGGVAFVALVPLLTAVWLARPERRAGWFCFRLGYVTGLVFFTATFYWLSELGPLFDTFFLRLLPFLLALYLALYVAVWAWFAGWLAGRHFEQMRPTDPLAPVTERPPLLLSTRNLALGIAIAAGWTALEWLRNCGTLSFGWNPLGVALHRDLTLIQIAEFTGVAGLSFLLVLCNAIGLITILRLHAEVGRQRLRPHFDFTITMALVVGTFSFGVQRTLRGPGEAEPSAVTLRVAAIQPNVAQREKIFPQGGDERALRDQKIFTQLVRLHAEALEPNLGEVDKFLKSAKGDFEERQKQLDTFAPGLKPQLVVWPEAGIPGGLLRDQEVYDAVRMAAATTPALLLGTDDFRRNHNSAAFLVPPPRLGSWGAFIPVAHLPEFYDKRRLVPFGEFLPFRGLLGWAFGELVQGDFAPGDGAKIFRLEESTVRIGPSICFEDTAAILTREPVLLGADLLVNVTNDGWFGLSAGAEQHLANAIFRTVENRRPLLRCTNTGVTCFIDAYGRVHRAGQNPAGADTDQWPKQFAEGVAKAKLKIPLGQRITFYTAHGDVFAAWCAVLAVGCMPIAILARRGRKKVPVPPLRKQE